MTPSLNKTSRWCSQILLVILLLLAILPPPFMPPKLPPKPAHLKQSAALQPSKSAGSISQLLSPKRGLGWPWDHQPALFALFAPHTPRRIAWLFNWELWRPQGIPDSVEWVPCLRTAAQIHDLEPFLTDINRTYPVRHLLGFNEPEIPDQANLGVDEAVKLWMESVLPVKNKLGLRLGSPGMSSDANRCLGWLDGFFDKCGGLKASGVEFLVLHWYGGDVEDMKVWLERCHDRYGGLPVWVNEWACSRMGQGKSGKEEVEAFMTEGLRWMDQTEWVERYSYYGMGQGRTVGGWVGEESNFVEGKEGEERLTTLGRGYCH